ncbi:MAG: T9SS type A sorting domain-containing protein, partial [Bacteroidota bacterium]
KILFQSMFSYAQGMSMTDAALLYLQADLTLSGGVHFNEACFWMLNRGLVSGCPVVGIDPVSADVPAVQLLNSDGLAYRGEAARLAFAENTSASLTLYDLQGRQVWQRTAVNGPTAVIPAEAVPIGVHVLQVETGVGTQSLKLVRLR